MKVLIIVYAEIKINSQSSIFDSHYTIWILLHIFSPKSPNSEQQVVEELLGW